MRNRVLLRLAVLAALAASCKSGEIISGNGDGDSGSRGEDGPTIDGRVGDGGPDAPPLASCEPTSGAGVRVEPFVTATEPVLVTSPPGDARQFVVEQAGRIRVVRDGVMLSTPFLDIVDTVLDGGERGLLGLAFHPSYGQNGRFYVYYTAGPDDVVTEFQRDATDPDLADPASARIVLTIPDFASNHNGGMIEFAPDGTLWIGTGDGGGGDDPNETGQDDTELLGKMLRIDVDTRTGGKQYGIPAGNPFAGSADGPTDPRPEIWAKGLRNPWRWSFDTVDGQVYIGDVGQGAIEEVDVVPIGSSLVNYGWDEYEGSNDHEAPLGRTGKTFPAVEHDRINGNDGFCSVIGGAVYRGSCNPDWTGWYFYTDYCSGDLWRFQYSGGAVTGHEIVDVPGFPSGPTSLHADASGELYVTAQSGAIFRLAAAP